MRPRRPTLERLETRLAPSASLFKDILPGPSGSDPQYLTAVGDTLYFDTGVPQDIAPTGQTSLWKSDGTPGGTILLGQFPQGVPSPYDDAPEYFTAFNGKVYFRVNTNVWVTDGTPA